MKTQRMLLAGIAGFLLAVQAVSGAGTDLANNSPFVPPNSNSSTAEQKTGGPLDKLELRGVTSVNGVQSFLLVDPAAKKSFWVDLHSTVEGYRVASYDPNAESVVVEAAGATRSVKLVKAKIVALAQPPPNVAAQGAPGANVRPAGNGPPAPSQLSDEEIRARMQRVAEEIRRRRALRREALQRDEGDNGGGNDNQSNQRRRGRNNDNNN